MKILRTRFEAQSFAKSAKSPIVLVPTMGALHDGHLSLIKQAKSHNGTVVASIFVNPMQFNDPKDLAKYPRNEELDLALIKPFNVDAVFAPPLEEIYSKDFSSKVSVGDLTTMWEGSSRPGHFDGVATVVNILFNCVRPDIAIFGEKDFQQLAVIRKMVSDLGQSVKIESAKLIRDSDGLALSSRNILLSNEARKAALSISRGLRKAVESFNDGEARATILIDILKSEIENAGTYAALSGLTKLDYVSVVSPITLMPVNQASTCDRILVAAFFDGIRLIDNIECF